MADQYDERDLSLIWITAGLLVVSAIIVYAMSSAFA